MRPRRNPVLPEAAPAAFWRRQAKWTARRHNLACVLGEFLPFCLGVSAVYACALLIVRESGGAHGVPWAAYGAALLVCAAAAWWRARRRFFTIRDALVRLEWNLGLHNRLSAAAAGVGAFPAAQAVADGYLFRWRKAALPPGGAAILVCAAAWIPVATRSPAYVPTVVPAAWTQTAAWIDALKKTDALQDTALEDLRERLEQLRKQPAEDWFSQSSLEAGDNLHEQTAQSMQSLQRDLGSALGSLEAMQRFTDGTPAGQMKAAREDLANALKGLELGNLPLNRDLLDGLKQAGPANLKTLSAAQLKALQRQLGTCDRVCAACLHPGEMEGRLAGMARGEGDQGRPGGTGGGTSSAPLNLAGRATDLATSSTAPVSNPDLDRAMPGDLLGVGKGKHDVDETKYTGPTPAGAASNGDGGEVVWRNDDLTPQERDALKSFFK